MTKQQILPELVNLCDYYQRELPEYAVDIWLDYLSDRLTVEEMKKAVRTAIEESQFMPTPKQLVEYVKGKSKNVFADEWQQILIAAAKAQRLADLEISKQAKWAINALGGIYAIGQLPEDRLPFVRKEYLTLCDGFSRQEKYALRPGGTIRVLPGNPTCMDGV